MVTARSKSEKAKLFIKQFEEARLALKGDGVTDNEIALKLLSLAAKAVDELRHDVKLLRSQLDSAQSRLNLLSESKSSESDSNKEKGVQKGKRFNKRRPPLSEEQLKALSESGIFRLYGVTLKEDESYFNAIVRIIRDVYEIEVVDFDKDFKSFSIVTPRASKFFQRTPIIQITFNPEFVTRLVESQSKLDAYNKTQREADEKYRNIRGRRQLPHAFSDAAKEAYEEMTKRLLKHCAEMSPPQTVSTRVEDLSLSVGDGVYRPFQEFADWIKKNPLPEGAAE